MKFQKPLKQIDFPKMEEEVLKVWKIDRIFERSVSEKSANDQWSFYDGPPFATGLPHHGHLLAGTIKDVIPRFWTMRGKQVSRRFGWDCHGLPVEFEIEKELNLKGRQDILNYGVGRFNDACRGIVLRYANEWRDTVERMGRWIDFDHDYKTMDPAFMESVWFIFKSLWDKGLIYEDKKVLPYSTPVASPLSNFEANLNYQNIQDPSIYIKFKVKNRDNTFLLVWTTTPWTLPANLGIAANPKFTYLEIRAKETGDIFILEEKLAGKIFKNLEKSDGHKILKRYEGRLLQGLHYEQLIPAFLGQLPKNVHQVFLADYVTDDAGTGLVHLAPAFGEDDYRIGKEHELPPLDHLDEQGHFTGDAAIALGYYFKDADKEIIAYLKSKGLLFRHETLQHSYPFCYRSDTPLIYRAISTWFVDVSKIKEKLIQNNQTINWVPRHLKDGRFGKWLEGARDWAISRNRFWGNPIPIWRDEESGESLCVGSIEELEKLTGKKIEDLHKQYLDPLTIVSPKTGKTLKRVPHVLDCWFESGSMPYAQQHYPFSINDEAFLKIFPADFIAEGLDQTRGWFYTLLVISTALGKGAPFKNVVVNGIVLAEDGRKMSKRHKNYPEPREVLDEFGADTLRIYLLQSGAVHGEDLRFSKEG
ncbi:MAG: isoleucine--tRNA ligase, partial [Bdellovibrionales bacterium]|nr:isoleucine--tRNA ligase [Bdellovibrionales bacterium]